MAKKKASPKKKITKKVSSKNSDMGGAAALLFAGACIVLLGWLQTGSIELLLVGFGSALALISAVLLGMAVSQNK